VHPTGNKLWKTEHNNRTHFWVPRQEVAGQVHGFRITYFIRHMCWLRLRSSGVWCNLDWYVGTIQLFSRDSGVQSVSLGWRHKSHEVVCAKFSNCTGGGTSICCHLFICSSTEHMTSRRIVQSGETQCIYAKW
jgi:hypothetical protein